jgi:hypothetical protein
MIRNLASGGGRVGRRPVKAGLAATACLVSGLSLAGLDSAFAAPAAERRCRAHEDTLRAVKLTALTGAGQDGIRVDYEIVATGRSTWTNMNGPLVRHFGVRTGRVFCLPHNANSDIASLEASGAD